MVDFSGERYRSNLMAHFEIRGGKIWILTDNTEDDLAVQILEIGISKQQIVLAIYSPPIREFGEFAVA